jgi:hypothetical protein
VKLVKMVQPSSPSRISELKVIQSEEDDKSQEYIFRYVFSLSIELTEFMEKYLRGMFSAYSLETMESKVGVGIIELPLSSA